MLLDNIRFDKRRYKEKEAFRIEYYIQDYPKEQLGKGPEELHFHTLEQDLRETLIEKDFANQDRKRIKKTRKLQAALFF